MWGKPRNQPCCSSATEGQKGRGCGAVAVCLERGFHRSGLIPGLSRLSLGRSGTAAAPASGGTLVRRGLPRRSCSLWGGCVFALGSAHISLAGPRETRLQQGLLQSCSASARLGLDWKGPLVLRCLGRQLKRVRRQPCVTWLCDLLPHHQRRTFPPFCPNPAGIPRWVEPCVRFPGYSKHQQAARLVRERSQVPWVQRQQLLRWLPVR